ncbi:hypothetical protein F5B22DRAFT_644416 [Xylaria bambusicola]|uniref:uncharacterized protein n=1 Tax=Xylaria bambusicola TaxID=326684 RepID=UPI002007E788|nr:uncharacterized protein F5B22DRAFT_644416 [Xylaria bambusicola]KAI0521168.1 hypothetical protein F5B22DRAFT_644416 [Xylaria bambusicola]
MPKISSLLPDGRLEPFTGDISMMEGYVDYFLRRVREDYPRITLQSLPSGTFASTTSLMPTSHLGDFKPKQAAGFTYNIEHVKGRAIVYASYAEARRGSRTRAFYLERWQNFLFVLACITAHEMSHLFALYLSLQADWPPTPPRVTYHGYEQRSGGESGRWLEGALFGGSLELFKRNDEGCEHPGRPYLLDQHGFYHRINPQSVIELVTNPWLYRFPFSFGQAETSDELVRQGLIRLAPTSEDTVSIPNRVRAMQILNSIRGLRGYSIHIDGFRQRPAHASLPLSVTTTMGEVGVGFEGIMVICNFAYDIIITSLREAGVIAIRSMFLVGSLLSTPALNLTVTFPKETGANYF